MDSKLCFVKIEQMNVIHKSYALCFNNKLLAKFMLFNISYSDYTDDFENEFEDKFDDDLDLEEE